MYTGFEDKVSYHISTLQAKQELSGDNPLIKEKSNEGEENNKYKNL